MSAFGCVLLFKFHGIAIEQTLLLDIEFRMEIIAHNIGFLDGSTGE